MIERNTTRLNRRTQLWLSLRALVLVTLFLCFSYVAVASHIIGGELKYKDLGEGEYEITLVVYRDCSGVDFSNPANIEIWGLSETSGLVESAFSIAIPLLSSDIIDVPVVLGNPCGIPPQGICIQEATYRATVILPVNEYGWDLSWSSCCRTPSSVNIDWDSTSGAVYAAHIPGVGNGMEYVLNTPPEFNLKPPTAICSNLDFYWDHSATDADGDSLVYELCTPFAEISYSPYAPGTDPFFPVIYAPGFNSLNPIASDPQIAIDANTGLITGMPNLPGQYAFAVCVSEYRDGVLLGSHQREFQFNVTFCDPNIEAIIEEQASDQLCSGQTLTIGNNSVNGSFYEWDFGVEDDLNDVSTEFEPTFTWPQLGEYDVTLVVNPGWPCADTSVVSYLITDSLVTSSFLSEVAGSPTDGYPNDSIVGVEAEISYSNGDQFPLQAWMESSEESFIWEGLSLDAVAIEGCNDLTLHISRDIEEAMDYDTVYFSLGGEAQSGIDFNDLSGSTILPPGITDVEIVLEVFLDDVEEGVETLVITQSVFDCDTNLTRTFNVAILDPVPFQAQEPTVSCLNADGQMAIGFNEVIGFGPFAYEWSINGGETLGSGLYDENLGISESIDFVNEDGSITPTQTIELALTDYCGNTILSTHELRNFVVRPEELCVDTTFAFPAFNSDLLVQDVFADGISMLYDTTLVDTLTLDAEWVDGLWSLIGLTTGGYDWTGEIAVVDSCGRTTSAQMYILEYPCTEGCTDEGACNYLGDAGIEDGSCEFPGDDCDDGDLFTSGEMLDENCECVAPIDAVDQASSTFRFFPNPSRGQLFVQSDLAQTHVRIISMDGRVVHEEWRTDLRSGAEIHLELQGGLYFVELGAGMSHLSQPLILNR